MLHYFYTLRILTNSQCFQSKKRFKQYKLHFLGNDGITKKCYDIAISCFVIDAQMKLRRGKNKS